MGRKIRVDSKIHGLPPEQRAKVDGWLFDKGLTYARVAEGCERMFGLKVSKSSVGRYFERETRLRLAKRRREEIRRQFAQETKGMSGAQRYDLLMERIATLAWDLLNPIDGPMEVRRICRLMRVLIAERRQRSSAIRATVERKRFEMSAARKCLEHIQSRKDDGVISDVDTIRRDAELNPRDAGATQSASRRRRLAGKLLLATKSQLA